MEQYVKDNNMYGMPGGDMSGGMGGIAPWMMSALMAGGTAMQNQKAKKGGMPPNMQNMMLPLFMMMYRNGQRPQMPVNRTPTTQPMQGMQQGVQPIQNNFQPSNDNWLTGSQGGGY